MKNKRITKKVNKRNKGINNKKIEELFAQTHIKYEIIFVN